MSPARESQAGKSVTAHPGVLQENGLQLEEIVSLLSSVGAAIKVVDGDQRITLWDERAQELLGFAPDEMVGQSCPGQTQGHDCDGKLVCHKNCEPIQKFRAREPIRYEMLAHSKAGDPVLINVNVVVVQPADAPEPVALHLMREGHLPPLAAPAAKDSSDEAVPNPPLSRRELEVLRLLAGGKGVQEIADDFVVSRATVRNHIANILGKLGVHSRLQAVVKASQQGLL
jgi:PAS domain S-box-containing protein